MKQKFWLGLGAFFYILTGLVVLARPVQTTVFMVYLVGAIFLVSGLSIAISAFREVETEQTKHAKAYHLFDGIVSIILGLFFLFGNTIVGALTLIYMMLFWLIFTSIIQAVIHFRLGGGWSIFSACMNVLVAIIGVSAFFDPELAKAIFVWSVAFVLIFQGVAYASLLFVRVEEITELDVMTAGDTMGSDAGITAAAPSDDSVVASEQAESSMPHATATSDAEQPEEANTEEVNTQ